MHIRNQDLIQGRGDTFKVGVAEEKYQDIEAQSLASANVANAQQIKIPSPAQARSSFRSLNAPNVMRTSTPYTAVSTTVPFEIEDDLPQKKYNKRMRRLRWTLLTIYRRLCLLVLVPNVVLIIILTAQHNLSKIALPDMATAVAANIAAATLMRQDLFVNLLFTLAGKCPHSAPLRLRRMFAKIYHLGGVHSGAGIAGTIWFTLFNAALLRRWQTNAIPGLPRNRFHFIIAITIAIDLLLLAIVIFAHPNLRRKYHNTFEAVHRFAGWLAVILFWIHLITLTQILEDSRQPKRPLGAALLQSPAVYFLILITTLLIIPWLRLRKVSVRVEDLSSHATRWHFQHTNPSLCSATRLTDHPLKDWHSFASIPSPTGHGFSTIISNAGDWTHRMISHPPSTLWTRGIPTYGVLHLAPLFHRIVVVATGSGIGPVLSLLEARNIPCRVLWSARDPINTYADEIVDAVFTADPRALIFDTKSLPRGRGPIS